MSITTGYDALGSGGRSHDVDGPHQPSSARATASGSLAITISSTCAALSGPGARPPNLEPCQAGGRSAPRTLLASNSAPDARANARHTSSTREPCSGRGRSVWIRSGGSMMLLITHGVESAPIRFWRLMENGLVSPSVEGTPQGGPLSPLLSNLVLDMSLNLMIFPLFMRLRCSRGDDANDVTSRRFGSHRAFGPPPAR